MGGTSWCSAWSLVAYPGLPAVEACRRGRRDRPKPLAAPPNRPVDWIGRLDRSNSDLSSRKCYTRARRSVNRGPGVVATGSRSGHSRFAVLHRTGQRTTVRIRARLEWHRMQHPATHVLSGTFAPGVARGRTRHRMPHRPGFGETVAACPTGCSAREAGCTTGCTCVARPARARRRPSRPAFFSQGGPRGPARSRRTRPRRTPSPLRRR